MQRAPGQHDDLTRVPCTRSRARCGGRSFATRHWCRATSRCSGRMEPAVRSPRIEPAISAARARKVRSGPKNSRFLEFLNDLGPPQPYCGERNFWMQRREAGPNRPGRPQMSPETESAQRYRRKSPQKLGSLMLSSYTRSEQAVRSPRIEFRISRPGSKGPLWPIPQDCRVPARPRAAATVPRGTEFLDAETGG
jgi:hypothetical protein